jgi:hypothetical protein
MKDRKEIQARLAAIAEEIVGEMPITAGLIYTLLFAFSLGEEAETNLFHYVTGWTERLRKLLYNGDQPHGPF